MDTSENVVTTGRRRRRRHSVLFKAEAVGACQQAGVSIAAVALARGVNANLLRRWVQAAERGEAPIAIRTPDPDPSTDRFVPVTLPPAREEGTIRIKIRQRGRTISIEWPASAATACAPLLSELMK